MHGFVVTPDDSGGPFPVLMFVHGGPTWLDLDRWQPEVQAYVDAGFAVGMVNYRGSIGYGREWRDALIANIGGPELEDVNAGLADLVERGIADPDRAVIAGHSWGGYVTLLELGKHPDLWRCGVAGVPIGDYEAGYEELSPLLQEYDKALLGGATPAEVPGAHARQQPDQLRRTTWSCPCSSSSAATTAAARTHRRWRTSTSSRRESIRTRSTCSRRATGRSTSKSASARSSISLGFLARHVPGVRVPDDAATTQG